MYMVTRPTAEVGNIEASSMTSLPASLACTACTFADVKADASTWLSSISYYGNTGVQTKTAVMVNALLRQPDW